jgi:DNA-binding IclR family transcriptional regulator
LTVETGQKIKSLAKALKILECFKDSPEMGISEISKKMGLYKSNVYDILVTFESLGYVGQNKNGKYHLGFKILELSHVITGYMGFRRNAYPYMLKIAEETGETVYLGVPDGTAVLYLDAAYPSSVFNTRSMLGERAPMYCTGIGKAILANLGKDTWERVFAQPKTKFTENTILDTRRLHDSLTEILAQGYAVDNMEHEHGVKCIGIAIINDLGEVAAGISISGPSLRFDDASIRQFVKLLKETVREMRLYF